MLRVSSDIVPLFLSLKSHDTGREFSQLWGCTFFLHSAPGEISHLSPQNAMSPFCPHKGARRIGSSQWEPTFLLRMCRVQKCINHLMIQGSVWPLPIWGWEAYPQTACSKVWAEGDVGQSPWASLCCTGAGACCPCMCCCLTKARTARTNFPAALGKSRRTWAQKDKKSRFCCYGQCYHIVPFWSLKKNVSSFYLRADELLHLPAFWSAISFLSPGLSLHKVTQEAAYSTETTASPRGQGQALLYDCCAFHLLTASCGKVILIMYESLPEVIDISKKWLPKLWLYPCFFLIDSAFVE